MDIVNMLLTMQEAQRASPIIHSNRCSAEERVGTSDGKREGGRTFFMRKCAGRAEDRGARGRTMRMAHIASHSAMAGHPRRSGAGGSEAS